MLFTLSFPKSRITPKAMFRAPTSATRGFLIISVHFDNMEPHGESLPVDVSHARYLWSGWVSRRLDRQDLPFFLSTSSTQTRPRSPIFTRCCFRFRIEPSTLAVASSKKFRQELQWIGRDEQEPNLVPRFHVGRFNDILPYQYRPLVDLNLFLMKLPMAKLKVSVLFEKKIQYAH